MSPESPLQHNLWTGALEDARTSRQRQAERRLAQPQQRELFSQRELAQFGLRARPQMSLSDHTRLALVAEDPRTPEEVERDLLRLAQSQTVEMFADAGTAEPVPVCWLTSEDLIACRPDLVEPLHSLTLDDLQQLAAWVTDALRDGYAGALAAVLAAAFGEPAEAEDPDDPAQSQSLP